MKTLFITYSYLGGHGGGVYASRTHINLFAALSEKLTLVYPYKQGEEPRGINEAKIEMIPVSDPRSNARKFSDLLRGKVHRYHLSNDFFDKGKYDVVVFDSSVVSSGLIKKFKKAGMKTVTIHHNYQIEYLLGDGSWLTLLPDLFWTRIYERQAVRNSDLNITLTQQDVELLQHHYGGEAPFAVLGVFEYQQSTPAAITPGVRGHRYVMTGGLGFKQTEDSVIRWIKEYYPELKKTDSSAWVTIAGSSPSERLRGLVEEAGIELIASPTDMAPILRNADYYLCPVDRGGGLKLRNLDGLKYGLPVLAHKVSIRGYEKMQEQGVIFSYETKEEFAAGVVQLNSLTLGKSEIQRMYLQQYQFDRGVKRMKDILTRNGIM